MIAGRTKLALAALAVILPAALAAYFIKSYSVNLLVLDEWELVEYAQDAIAAGQKKALIVLGHVVSEQAGMKYCAEWLKGFIQEVPIEFVAAAEPFWRPGQPVR